MLPHCALMANSRGKFLFFFWLTGISFYVSYFSLASICVLNVRFRHNFLQNNLDIIKNSPWKSSVIYFQVYNWVKIPAYIYIPQMHWVSCTAYCACSDLWHHILTALKIRVIIWKSDVAVHTQQCTTSKQYIPNTFWLTDLRVTHFFKNSILTLFVNFIKRDDCHILWCDALQIGKNFEFWRNLLPSSEYKCLLYRRWDCTFVRNVGEYQTTQHHIKE